MTTFKLSLNVNKTQYINFSNKNNNTNMHKSVTINNISLKKSGNIKFLGVVIDSKLACYTHISFIKGNASGGIATCILCKARRLLKASTLITLYHSFIYPYFTYCIKVWCHTFDKYISCHTFDKYSSLFKVQKRAVRIITSSSYLAHTLPICSNNKILNIYIIYNYQLLIFMLKHKTRIIAFKL